MGGYIRATVIGVSVTVLLAPTTAGAVDESVAEFRVGYAATEGEGFIAVDSSAYANHGKLLGGVTRKRGVYRFHPVTRDGRYDRIRAPYDPSLSPGSSPFSYGARVKVRPDATWSHREMALVRLGDSDTPGGDYKLELRKLKDGTVDALCEMHDGAGGSGYLQDDAGLETIDDGKWHKIACARVDEDTMRLTIDGNSKDAQLEQGFGAIASERDPLLIGCQPFAIRPDLRFREQLHGAIDDIFVVVQPVEPTPVS